MPPQKEKVEVSRTPSASTAVMRDTTNNSQRPSHENGKNIIDIEEQLPNRPSSALTTPRRLGHANMKDDGLGMIPRVESNSEKSETELNIMHLEEELIEEVEEGWHRFVKRMRGDGKIVPNWTRSIRNVVTCSPLNLLLILIPISWVAHFLHWAPAATFTLCLFAITGLEKILDYVGENFAIYCGQSLGDLVIISLQNTVEATLAILLLKRCDLRLLQSTVVGVVLLHLLLVPGVAFLNGGREMLHQQLDPHLTELNKSLLTLGVLAMLVPAAFFSGIRDNVAGTITPGVAKRAIGSILEEGIPVPAPVSDETRDGLLKLSRGLAIILLVGYVGSRIYLHNPPGAGNAGQLPPNTPEVILRRAATMEEEQPKMNQLSCLLVFLLAIPLTAVTAEWLVDSLENVREHSTIKQEWFGLILLPVVSFSGEALVTITFYARKIVTRKVDPPSEIAKARTIDMSIQFTMFWMPFLVLLAWWTDKPLFMLFDFFEVAVAIGSCFLVNAVTDDAKTNWAEGLILLSFYFMIATSAWFYVGQQEVADMLLCKTVASVISGVDSGSE